MSRYRNRQHNALRVMTSSERRQSAADEFQRKSLDAALKRALKNLPTPASERPAS